MRNKYTIEMLKFIEINKTLTNKELILLFYKKFDILLNKSKIKNIRYKYNMLSGNNVGRFKKGHIPFNKNKKQIEYMEMNSIGKIKRTQYKKGNIPHNNLPVGTKRKTKDGYIQIKIANPNIWEYEHRIKFGQNINENEIVIFKDGNKLNTQIANLEKIDRSLNLILNKNNLRYNNSKFTESGILVGKIIDSINKKLKVDK